MATFDFSVCLFCGSQTGDDPAFAEEARLLGARLAEGGHRLVYGAGDRGLMGEAARATQQAGGHILGVIPRHLLDREVGKRDIDEFLVVETMHERKKLMFDRSEAVVALPGGAGTLDELLEVLTWRQLGLHAKPVLLVDPNGYWRPLEALVEHVIAHGFANERLLHFFERVTSAEQAVERIEGLLASATDPAPAR